MMEKHAMKLADKCSVHELHVFHAADALDKMAQIKSFYSKYHTKYPKSVMMLADADVVYMDMKAFDKAVKYAASHAGITLPNMVNSAAGALAQRQQGCLPAEFGDANLKALLTH